MAGSDAPALHAITCDKGKTCDISPGKRICLVFFVWNAQASQSVL